MLIRVQVMTRQLATHHPTDGVDKITMIEVLKPILVRIMGIGTTIEVVSRRVFDSVLVASILQKCQNMCNGKDKRLTRYSSSLNIKGVMARPALVRLLAWPQIRTAVRPIPRWLTVPEIV